MNSPLFSVIMPCYKMGQFIGEALASVGAQSHNDWEVLAIDDCGPEDGTREAVEAFAASHPNHRVEYVRLDSNRGVSIARNTGIRSAHGSWLAFLDPDDVWDSNKLAMQMDEVAGRPDVIGVFAFGRIEKCGKFPECWSSLDVMGRVDAGVTMFDPLSIVSGRVMFPFSSVILRRDIVLKVGGFQEGIKFAEDRILLACVAALGPIIGVQQVLCTYRVHEGSATTMAIQQDGLAMGEFELRVRVSLWLRSQSQLRKLGAELARGPFREVLVGLLQGGAWHHWRYLFTDLCARLVLAYPRELPFVAWEFWRQTPLIALVRRILKIMLVPDGGNKYSSQII